MRITSLPDRPQLNNFRPMLAERFNSERQTAKYMASTSVENDQAKRASMRVRLLTIGNSLFSATAPPNASAWDTYLSSVPHMRIAGRPVVIGRENVVAELAILFRPILTVGTEFRHLWIAPEGNMILVESDVTVAASARPVPLAIVLRCCTPEILIQDLRFYLDPGSLTLPS